MGVSNAVEGTLSGRERQTVWAAMAMVWPTQLESRLTAILDPRRRRGGLGRKPAAVALLAAIFVLVPLATLPFGADHRIYGFGKRANRARRPNRRPGRADGCQRASARSLRQAGGRRGRDGHRAGQAGPAADVHPGDVSDDRA